MSKERSLNQQFIDGIDNGPLPIAWCFDGDIDPAERRARTEEWSALLLQMGLSTEDAGTAEMWAVLELLLDTEEGPAMNPGTGVEDVVQ